MKLGLYAVSLWLLGIFTGIMLVGTKISWQVVIIPISGVVVVVLSDLYIKS